MLDLASIIDRWAKATPGPWEWEGGAGDWQRYRLWRASGCAEVIIPAWDGEGEQSMQASDADARAIAAAPTDIAALLSEVAHLRSELAAAQAERDRLAADAQRWAMIRDTVTRLDAESRPGLPMGDDDIEQVVLRVLERTARKPAPVAPQVVRLHQAYEGTTTCLHCGKPMPWSEMDRCPRDSGFPTAPPCAG